MAEFRTTKQIEADKIDTDAYHLVLRLEGFAEEIGDKNIGEMARTIDSMRSWVRNHMHRNDREVTS